jgi:hypothetical protein
MSQSLQTAAQRRCASADRLFGGESDFFKVIFGTQKIATVATVERSANRYKSDRLST